MVPRRRRRGRCSPYRKAASQLPNKSIFSNSTACTAPSLVLGSVSPTVAANEGRSRSEQHAVCCWMKRSWNSLHGRSRRRPDRESFGLGPSPSWSLASLFSKRPGARLLRCSSEVRLHVQPLQPGSTSYRVQTPTPLERSSQRHRNQAHTQRERETRQPGLAGPPCIISRVKVVAVGSKWLPFQKTQGHVSAAAGPISVPYFRRGAACDAEKKGCPGCPFLVRQKSGPLFFWLVS